MNQHLWLKRTVVSLLSIVTVLSFATSITAQGDTPTTTARRRVGHGSS